MTRKLRVSEFSPLIEKLIKKFNSWAVSTLSFAGRLQLIKSVIYGLINFWSSTFILPKACTKKMESLCARFLWAGMIDRKVVARVAWADICYPKQEGGLGLRRLDLWNSTLCIKLIWLLFSGSGSLWVAWHHYHHIRDMSFWAIKASASDSWNWKSILLLRNIAHPYVECVLGNGSSASFWFDNWTPMGPLINFIGEDGPRVIRIDLHATVDSACDDQGWNLAAPRSLQAEALHAHLATIDTPLRGDVLDRYYWVINGQRFQHFNTAKTWDSLRPRNLQKAWASSVWFKGSTPKHAFHMWVAQLNRLPTKDRLYSWGLPIDPLCGFCSRFTETRDHIFLTCVYSERIWAMIHNRLGLNPCIFYSWNALLAWTNIKTPTSPTILRKLATQAALYHLWKQRNNLLHNHTHITTDILFKEIDKVMRNTITARRSRKKFRELMVLWIR